VNRRTRWLLVTVVGAAICVIAAAGLALGQHDLATARDFGPAPPPAISDPATRGRPVPGDPRLRPTTPNPRSSALSPVRPVSAPPVRLAIPALTVTATVQSVASVDGVLTVPDDISQVGWWAGSAAPGAASGTVVIDGHVDSATDGLGALFHLTDLRPGDLITLTTLQGTLFTYTVTMRRTTPKFGGMPADLFTTGGPARLALITCGGPFDTTTRSYRDNVVVIATPTP